MSQSQHSQEFKHHWSLTPIMDQKKLLFLITKKCTPTGGAITTKTNWETDRTQPEIDSTNTLS